MANTYTYTGPGTRWTVGNPTAKDLLDLARINVDHLHEALNTIMSTAAADGNITFAGASTIATGANGNLTIDTGTGDLIIDPGANRTVLFGQLASATGYNSLSLNGSHAAATKAGLSGGGTGDDALYVDSGTRIDLRIAETWYAQVDAGGLNVKTQIEFDTAGTVRAKAGNNLTLGGGTDDIRIVVGAINNILIGEIASNADYQGISVNNSLAAATKAGIVGGGSGDNALYVDGGSAVVFRVAEDEKVRIDSAGNVGIGTATPAEALHVVDSTDPTIRLDDGASRTVELRTGDSGVASPYVGTTYNAAMNFGANDVVIFSISGADGSAILDLTTTGNRIDLDTDNDTSIRASADDTIMFEMGGTDFVSFNPNGHINFGGTTVESWDTAYIALQVGSNGSIMSTEAAGAGSNTFLNNNCYWDGSNWKYQDTDQASQIWQTGGEVMVRVVASGTADANITWVEAMRIDNAGNVGIGTATPAEALHVVDSTDPTIRLDDGASRTVELRTGDSGAASPYVGTTYNAAMNFGANDVVIFSISGADGSAILDLTTTGNRIDLDTDNDTSIRCSADDVIQLETAGSDRITIGAAGSVYINDSANANMTIGLTINQGPNDDEALALKSSDVAHALTSLTETDTYYRAGKYSATLGGMFQRILAEDGALSIVWGAEVYGGTAQTTKTTSGLGLIDFLVAEHDGAGTQADITADGNVFTIRARVGGSAVARLLVDEDGDLYSVIAAQTFDDMDDVALLSAYDAAVAPDQVIRTEFEDFTKYNEQTLIDAKLIGAPVADGGMMNDTQFIRLHNGAIRQLGREKADRSEVEQLRSELAEAQAQLKRISA